MLYFLVFPAFHYTKKSDKGARALLSLHLFQRVFVIFLAPIKNTFTVFDNFLLFFDILLLIIDIFCDIVNKNRNYLEESMSKTRQKTAEDISIVLTKISLSILFIASIVLIAIGPWVVSLVIEFPSPFFQGESRYWILLLLGYVLGCLALTCIVHLYRLLSRIGKNQVFIRQNVQYMRYLGWEVGMVALISFFMGLTVYMPMLLVAVSCCILTLIIRVIRNAFGKAIELQEEVDYTI
ncbi:hypothetical protein I872_09235 [Streptococcus cristatus AS 1.3089]|nr:hypothetical protein I872_09235 [Streptococcus cristatus AS 1.3089]